ncbi:MAG: hypothetical protein ACOVOV_02560 [Dolichospermum sp.]
MSNVTKCYQFHPENFQDDLVEALSVSFKMSETHARNQHETFLANLLTSGYEIVPQGEMVVEGQPQVWFIRVFLKKEWNAQVNDLKIFRQLKFYNFRTTGDIDAFRIMLKELCPNLTERSEPRQVTFNLGQTIDVKLAKIKL